MSADDADSSKWFCCIQDFENHAQKYLPRMTFDFYETGACGLQTLRNNQESFQKLRIRPTCLQDITERDIKTKVLDMNVDVPIGVSPTGLQKLVHPEGEIANARAAGLVGGVFILSLMSNTSLEEVAYAAPNTTKWFQLYVHKNRDEVKKLVQRVETAGFKALVLTVDVPVVGIRYKDVRNSFHLPPHLRLGNFDEMEANSKLERRRHESSLTSYCDFLHDESLQWKDLEWIKTITKLPILLKGVLTAEDALLAVKYNVAGIIVSNHGGRQLDTAPSSIEALPEIVKAVGGRIDVYLDGGIRYGTDIFKALALGAKMVFVGRPALWGLAHSGERGVKKVLEILINELKTTMGLAGCNKLADIKKEMVVHESFYHKL